MKRQFRKMFLDQKCGRRFGRKWECKMNATVVVSAITVNEVQTLPNGVQVCIVPCSGYDAFKALPAAIDFEDKRYGLTGWNSDRYVAYYRTDRAVAMAV